jgi:hypothetical protein
MPLMRKVFTSRECLAFSLFLSSFLRTRDRSLVLSCLDLQALYSLRLLLSRLLSRDIPALAVAGVLSARNRLLPFGTKAEDPKASLQNSIFRSFKTHGKSQSNGYCCY